MKLLNLKNKVKFVLAPVAAVVGTSAHAALPTDAANAVTSISTFATDMIAAAWPIAATIVAASVGIKLFKKFSSKAS